MKNRQRWGLVLIFASMGWQLSMPHGNQVPSPPTNLTFVGETILFQEPEESGIGGNLVVPLAVHKAPPQGVFVLILWQPNPNTASGQLVQTTWNASSKTGFTPTAPINAKQLGFQDKVGATTAQIDGGTVGVYLNSADLPNSPVSQKMMITPQFSFVSGEEPLPFANPALSLNAAMDLQIPVAVGSDTYVLADFLFRDPNGMLLSYGTKIFANGSVNPVVGAGYDTPSGAYMLNSPLGIDERFVTRAPGSGSATGATWLGWRHFEWSISHTQFAAALAYLATQFPGKVQVTDPGQYVLIQTHVNAEFHFQPAPAELGWSMRGWTVWE
jgi:hypothetical protein